jgi:hypothetical protein
MDPVMEAADITGWTHAARDGRRKKVGLAAYLAFEHARYSPMRRVGEGDWTRGHIVVVIALCRAPEGDHRRGPRAAAPPAEGRRCGGGAPGGHARRAGATPAGVAITPPVSRRGGGRRRTAAVAPRSCPRREREEAESREEGEKLREEIFLWHSKSGGVN